jgi:hypothetical protein
MERSGVGRNAMRAHPRSLLSIILLPLRLFSTQFGDEQADLPNLKAGVGWHQSMAALRLIPVVPAASASSPKRTYFATAGVTGFGGQLRSRFRGGMGDSGYRQAAPIFLKRTVYRGQLGWFRR